MDMVNAVTGFSRNGVFDWIVQRATSVIMLAYFIFMMGYFLTHSGVSYEEWHAFFTQTSVRIFSVMALVSFFLHAWIGMWFISVDYITDRLLGENGAWLRLGENGTWFRMAFQFVCAVINFTYLVWGIQVLWGV